MFFDNKISDEGVKKLQLYFAAKYLFDNGKSHPQIMKILEVHETNYQNLLIVVDKAMHDEWDNLYKEAHLLFSEGLIYSDVFEIISQKETDKEIAKWICGEWYKLKVLYAECLVDHRTNIFEGIKWMIICGVALLFFFYIGVSWITKTIWIIVFVFSTFQWIVGVQQKVLSEKIDRLFTEKFEIKANDEK